MNKFIFSIVLCALSTSLHAKLPSMCFDGTYAGGDECGLTVDGVKIDAGLAADEFFMDDDDITLELNDLYKDLHDKLEQQ